MLRIEDERAIVAVLHAYSTGIDRRDWALFRTVFADTIDVDYGAFGAWTSGDAMTEAMSAMHAPLGSTLHRLTNIVVTATDDGAAARTYFDAVLMTGNPDAPKHQALGVYDDRFGRERGRWVIRRRRIVPFP